MSEFLVKYVDSTGQAKHRPVDELVDGFRFAFIQLGGTFQFNESNIVTVSGVNSLEDTITELSGAVDIRDQEVCDKVEAASGVLFGLINGVSGASDINDSVLDLKIDSVSSASDDNDAILLAGYLAGDAVLDAKIDSVSGTSEFNDNALLALINGVSGSSDDNDNILDAKIDSVSGTSEFNDNALLALIDGVSGSSDDNDALLQAQINAIVTDTAQEECIESVSGETVFTVSGFAFSADNNIKDLLVFRNMGHVKQGRDYDKISTTAIDFRYATEPGDLIAIREERTGGSGSGGGGSGGGSGGSVSGFEWNLRVETGNVTDADHEDDIIMDHVASVTVDLPASPSLNERVRVGDGSAAGASVNQIVVSGNGNTINGSPTFAINADADRIEFVWAGSLFWRAFRG